MMSMSEGLESWYDGVIKSPMLLVLGLAVPTRKDRSAGGEMMRLLRWVSLFERFRQLC